MTSIFEPNGKQVACTIIEAGPCVVTQKKTVDTDGYNSLQIAYGDAKQKNTPNAQVHHFAKAGTTPKSVVKEIRNCSIDKNVGENITCEIFTEGEKVSVIGTSKGKGFQGVVKRHGFGGAHTLAIRRVAAADHEPDRPLPRPDLCRRRERFLPRDEPGSFAPARALHADAVLCAGDRTVPVAGAPAQERKAP